MREERKGSLELNWINKNKSLLYEYDEDGEPKRPKKWVDKDDLRVAEPRVLKFIKSVGTSPIENFDSQEKSGNMLIKGDNLLALRSLVEKFKEKPNEDKIKCIYIDPPFNTQQAFEDYDDNLEKSEWLSLMSDRLNLLKKLLKKEGVVFVHIDKNSLFSLKILMDEIYGSENFINIISWQRAPEGRTVLGQGSTPILTSNEFILIYAKSIDYLNINKIHKKIDATEKIMKQYNILVEIKGKKNKIKEFEDNYGNPVKIYQYEKCKVNRISKKRDDYKDYYLKHFEKMAQSVGIQTESTFQQNILSELPNKEDVFLVEYTPSRGKNAGEEQQSLYQNNRKLIFAKNYSSRDGDKLYRDVDMNNFWKHEEIPVTGIINEGNVKLKRGKKPEHLLKRILEIGTNKGDLVLDSFLGSGTTAAVAHKMNRKWIGIELKPSQFEKSLKRLERVIDRDDPDRTGISKDDDIDWNGGGGFSVHEIGESILSEDGEINWFHSNEEIAKSIFWIFDYRFSDDLYFDKEYEVYLGQKKEKFALSIISEEPTIIQKEELDKFLDLFKEKYSENKEIEIYTNHGVGIEKKDLPNKITIQKVPDCILEKYKLGEE